MSYSVLFVVVFTSSRLNLKIFLKYERVAAPAHAQQASCRAGSVGTAVVHAGRAAFVSSAHLDACWTSRDGLSKLRRVGDVCHPSFKETAAELLLSDLTHAGGYQN